MHARSQTTRRAVPYLSFPRRAVAPGFGHFEMSVVGVTGFGQFWSCRQLAGLRNACTAPMNAWAGDAPIHSNECFMLRLIPGGYVQPGAFARWSATEAR